MRTHGLSVRPLVALLEVRKKPVDVPDSYMVVLGWTVPSNQVLSTALAAGVETVKIEAIMAVGIEYLWSFISILSK